MALILENEKLRVQFDSKTGAITGLLNKITGWKVIQQPKLSRGIRLLVPIPGFRNNRVNSECQHLDVAQIDEPGTFITLQWGRVIGEKSGPLDISVTQRVSLKGPDLEFTAHIENRSPYTIEEVWSPYLGGIYQPDQSNFEAMTVSAQGCAARIPLGKGFPGVNFNQSTVAFGYWGFDYPTEIRSYPTFISIAPFMLLCNRSQGIYVGVHDQHMNAVSFLLELRPGYLDSMNNIPADAFEVSGKPVGFMFSPVRFPFLNSGESIDLAPVVLHFYEGSWHKGVDRYVTWRNSWFKRYPAPQWIEDVDAWFTLHINSPEDCCRYNYKELVPIVKEAKEKGVGVLQLIGWSKRGQDGRFPCHDPDARLGTMREFLEVLRKIEKDIGVRVLLYSKFTWADRTSSWFRDELIKYAVRDPYGDYPVQSGAAYQTLTQLTGNTAPNSVPMCHASEEYRKVCMKEFEKILHYGTSGTLCDEVMMGFRLFCFDPNHGHKIGDCFIKGSLKLTEQFYKRAKEFNPDFVLAGEGPQDFFCQYYSISYIRSWDKYHIPMQKYMDPEMKIATCITGWNDKNMINQCLMNSYIINYEPYNFKGRLSDFPDTVEYGQKVQKLRRKLWDYVWKGRFLDRLEAQVTFDGDSHWPYTVFENKRNKKKAVVIANYKADKTIEVLLKLQRGGTRLNLYTPEEDNVGETDGKIVLSPRSVVVAVET